MSTRTRTSPNVERHPRSARVSNASVVRTRNRRGLHQNNFDSLRTRLAEQIVWRDINNLKPFPKNPRRHPEAQIAALMKGIKHVWTNPILIDETQTILAGHARLEAATLRAAVNYWYGETLSTRLNDKRKGAIILAMQRLHEDDLAGKLLLDKNWKHLDLPAIAQEDQTVSIGDNAVKHWREGELLHFCNTSGFS